MNAEIFVVDNLSTDGSVEMVKEKFPNVILIANEKNVGFAKANNQAVARAKGDYILYLNPDTIVPEDCFEKCLAYMNAHSDVGALGCRLVDGQGQFLPESKRGFPDAKVAFFKITGFSSLFKKSKYFNGYHLGYLPEHETNEVDVLAGCFMFCRKDAVHKAGSFDEDYFMYGEDIDLSYKIKKQGFKNIYFPETTVIHYKGESTKKGSLNYVKMFYQAMIIFAKKHLSNSKKTLYIFLIQIAIYLKAILAYISRLIAVIRMPLIDAALLLSSLTAMKYLWIKNVKTETHYSPVLLTTFFISYVIIWLLSMFFNGAYDKPYKPIRIMRGMFIGAIITLAMYGLLNEEIRFSRGITVLGALGGMLLILLSRKLMQLLNIKSVERDTNNNRVIIVGTPEDENEIMSLLKRAYLQKHIVGVVSPFDTKQESQLGILSNIKPLCKLYNIHEIIFAQHHLAFKQIIDIMQECGHQIEYKIHSSGTDSIIGSNSKNTAGDLYTTELIYEITTPSSKRNKRLIDVVFSSIFLLLSPLVIWFVKNKIMFFLNMFLVLEGDKTFVGYSDSQFPKLKPSLMNVFPEIENFNIPEDNREHLNWLYAKNYDAWTDVKIILSKWRNL